MHLSRRFYRTPYSRDDPGLQHQVFCCSSITLHSSISNPHINHSHCYCFSIPLDTNYFPTVSSCDFKTNYSCPVKRLKFSIFSLKKRKQIAIPKLGRFSICEIFYQSPFDTLLSCIQRIDTRSTVRSITSEKPFQQD